MSPYEVAARERKAAAIATMLLAMTDDMTEAKIAQLRTAPADFRVAAASHAGQQAPSDVTWNRVVEVIEQAAEWAGLDPFARF